MSVYGKVGLLLGRAVPLGLFLASVVVALLLGELLVRLTANSGDLLLATLIDDPVLGQRIEPNSTGHDALGFRNEAAPAQVNLVAIGDSQTYGVSAPREGSWPHQLGVLLREPVYSMALGGYGPLEYLHLATHDAKRLRPRVLLVGFYFGNDLADACRAAHRRPHWRAWREAGTSIVCDQQGEHSAQSGPKKRFAAVRDWLSRHSALYSLLRITLLSRLAASEKDTMAIQVPPDRQLIWTDPSAQTVRTIFTPQIRLSVLDPQLAHVQEGLRITKRVFASLRSDTQAQGSRLLLILIPTKERAYCRYLAETGARLPSTFKALCDAEEHVKNDLIQFLTAAKIAHVDVTRAMEEQVRKHVQIYPTDTDGHPRASGYGAIAQAVYDALRRQQ